MLRKCSNKSCSTYTLKETCPKCSSNTQEPMYKYRERFLKNKN